MRPDAAFSTYPPGPSTKPRHPRPRPHGSTAFSSASPRRFFAAHVWRWNPVPSKINKTSKLNHPKIAAAAATVAIAAGGAATAIAAGPSGGSGGGDVAPLTPSANQDRNHYQR